MKCLRLAAGCLGIGLFISAGCRRPDTSPDNPEILSVEWEKLPDLPGSPNALPFGISAPFCGVHHNRLLVAGGCNFPDTPAAEGGNKRYYDEIWMLDLSGKNSGNAFGKRPRQRETDVNAETHTPDGTQKLRPESLEAEQIADKNCPEANKAFAKELAGNPEQSKFFAPIAPVRWKLGGKLPVPTAYGASVSTPDGVICIGGNNRDSLFVQVIRLSWDEKEERIDIGTLPSLPFPLDNLAAAYAENKIYVAGGNRDGHPSSAFLCLDLTHPGKGWMQLPSFPGSARVQPVMAAQQSPDGVFIYLAGGFQPPLNGETPVLPTDLLAYSPEQKQWKSIGALPSGENGRPHTFTGGGCIAWGDRSLLFMGGVDYDRFLSALDRPRQIESAQAAGNQPLTDSLQTEAQQYLRHPVSWYRFNRELWEYDTFTGCWRTLGTYEPLARAGAGIVRHGRYLIIVNGELKPGIRTPRVNKARL